MDKIPVPEALQPYMPLIVGVVTAIAIFVVGWLASKWVSSLVVKVLRRRAADESLVKFLAMLAQLMVLAATVITALARVGVETTSLVALLGSAGIAIGLALQGNLSHFASGVMLLVFRPFTVGDYIEGGGKTGTVEEVGLFATMLTTPDNHRVLVPNATVTSGPITNFTTLGTRRATIEVGVAYGSDVAGTTEVLLAAARSSAAVLADPAPEVTFAGLGANSLDFKLRIWSVNADYLSVQSVVRTAVYERLNAAGIEIPFNQIVLHQAPGTDSPEPSPPRDTGAQRS